MAKEAKKTKEPEKKEGEDAAAAAGPQPKPPMMSKIGWIIYAVTVVLLVGLFFFFVHVINKPAEVPVEKKKRDMTLNQADLNAMRTEIKNPIVVSVPTNELATEFRFLAINLTVTYGRMPDENEPSFNLEKTLTAEGFSQAATTLVPYIEDKVNKIALSYTYLQLNEESTREDFRQRLIQELNQLLRTYNMKPRVRDVLFNKFIFSE